MAFENAWGVADEVLFTNASRLFDKVNAAGRSFFAHIITTSKHGPVTYPTGRIDIPSPSGRDGGVKYTDHAIGKFIDEARNRPWFADTLFVFTADHCAAVAGKTRLPLGSYLIPMIMYAPALVGPGVYTRLASQIDVPPTILDLLGAAGDDHFFGQGLFEDEQLPPRAFVSNYQELGYYKDDVLAVFLPKQRVEAFRIDPVNLVSKPIEPITRLIDEAIAYYQTASRAFRTGKMRSPDFAPNQALSLLRRFRLDFQSTRWRSSLRFESKSVRAWWTARGTRLSLEFKGQGSVNSSLVELLWIAIIALANALALLAALFARVGATWPMRLHVPDRETIVLGALGVFADRARHCARRVRVWRNEPEA